MHTGKEKQADDKNRVTEAEKESFPSSYPPSWTSGEASPDADANHAERKAGGLAKEPTAKQQTRDAPLEQNLPTAHRPPTTVA